MAEVMKFSDFKEEGSENAVKVRVCSKKIINVCGPTVRGKTSFLFHRRLGNIDNRAGTTLWRTGTLSFSNSTHPTPPKRNNQCPPSEGEVRVHFLSGVSATLSDGFCVSSVIWSESVHIIRMLEL